MTTDETRLSPQRLAQLFGIALAIIGIWILASLFTTSEFYRRSIAGGGTREDIKYVLGFQITVSLTWAVATPIIIAIAERLPLRKPYLLRNALLIVLLLPVIALIRAVVGGVILNLGELKPVSLDMMRLSVAIRTHRNIAIGAMIVIFTNLVIARREASARARRELAAQALLARAELDELRAQMQPHFLFLTLHTIGDMVHTDPNMADDMIVGLADLLRRSLALGNDPIPLAEELDFVDRYLALYTVAFGGRVAVRFDADEEVLTAQVLPLIVQQLVESAVVNGIAPAGGGDLEIRAWCDGEQLHLDVSDSGSDLESRNDERTLAPVRVRLAKWFDGSQSLSVRRDEHRFVAAMTTPLDLPEETVVLEAV
jgi:two-component system LytT family sensor kinase